MTRLGARGAWSLGLLLGLLARSCGFPLLKTASVPRTEKGEISMPASSPEQYWALHKVAFSLLPLAPGPRRKTIVEEVVRNSVWTFDQIQGVVNVNVPVRGVLVKLRAGGLLFYNPVAPTKEVLKAVRAIEATAGPVKHIVLGSLGLEHKALAGPFSQYFPKAQVWQQPGQWSFPLNLPSSFFGFPLTRLKDIPIDPANNPWSEDFDIAVLEPLRFKSVGGFGETALFHRDSKTLLVTDAVIRVPTVPPPIIQEDPRALLFHSRDNMLSEASDTPEARRRGWRRMALFGLFFVPSGIDVNGVGETFAKLQKVSPTARLLGRGAIPIDPALYPWTWSRDDKPNFDSLQRGSGGLLVAPILRKLILNREPAKVLRWVDAVAKFPFRRIIPAHFDNNVPATGKDFRAAFAFLSPSSSSSSSFSFSSSGARPGPNKADYSLLDTLSEVFTALGVVAAPEVQEP